LSHDPFSIENFSSEIWLLNPSLQNSYSYSTNDPVNKVDPDGKLTIIVPGTWYGNDSWSAFNSTNPITEEFIWTVGATFGEVPIVMNNRTSWTGGNNDTSRQDAATQLSAFINNYKFADGEQLNIVAHSHGGNTVKAAAWKIDKNIDNMVTFGTPVRSDYTYTHNSKIKNAVEVYSNIDGVQSRGGDKYKVGGLVGNLLDRFRSNGSISKTFEIGPASRQEVLTNSVNATSYTTKDWTSTKAHSQIVSSNVWFDLVVPKLKIK
jgi:hypothetical protein